MPTYEYRCTDCGNVIEIFQRIGEDPLTICDVCGGALRKVFHPAGIVFKGSGFYATDSRSARKADGKGKDEKATQTSEAGKGDSGSEKAGSDGGSSEKRSSGSETTSSGPGTSS